MRGGFRRCLASHDLPITPTGETLRQISDLGGFAAGSRREEAARSERAGEGSAIDKEGFSGDVATGFAGEQKGGAGQLIRLPPALEGGAGGEGVFFRLAEQAHGEIGEEWAWADAVDGDLEGAEVDGAGFGHADERGFGGGIDVALLLGADAEHGGDM